uniref:Translation elongation factor 1A-like n=1 Tax=Gymnochlora stellata TaxID=67809 RepID=B5A4P5_GYMST|nr:translation elongation factor 1A-like [Gymnochlora stellata]
MAGRTARSALLPAPRLIPRRRRLLSFFTFITVIALTVALARVAYGPSGVTLRTSLSPLQQADTRLDAQRFTHAASALESRRTMRASRNVQARGDGEEYTIEGLSGGGDAAAAPADSSEPLKPHLSIVICGHVDSGKSTTTGRLLFELGGIEEREMERLKSEAKALNKETFLFAFYMDRQKEERERGVTITCATKEFFTEKWHYTIIDAPGHKDFIKNMISGAAQADVALLMLPADGNAWTAIQKGNHKVGEVQGQTRHHARLLNLLGVKQLICAVNKMDCDQAKYSKARYDEILKEFKSTLAKVGWKKDFIDKSIPFLPLSGFGGDNLIQKSKNMDWWNGCDITTSWGDSIHVNTLLDCLNSMVRPPPRKKDAPLRLPVAGVYRIKGVGDVLAGRVEQGVLKNEADVIFLPTHVPNHPCNGKVFSIEMHHKRMMEALPGDNIGMNVKGFPKDNPPRSGDVMILSGDKSLQSTGEFTAQVQVLDVPHEVKPGYSPIGFVRCGRSACKLKKINWKMGKETGGKKVENPAMLKHGEMAEVVFEPMFGFVAEPFKRCEGLARIAFLDGNGVVMLGKVTKTVPKSFGSDKKDKGGKDGDKKGKDDKKKDDKKKSSKKKK